MTEDLLKLAERCEQATGPDRELDGYVWWHTGIGPSEYPEYANLPAIVALGRVFGRIPTVPEDQLTIAEVGYRGPRYTASLDAAMSLVPEGCGFHLDRYWIASRKEPAWLCEISTGGIPSNPRQVYAGDDAWSAALAVTCAALRARAAALQGEG